MHLSQSSHALTGARRGLLAAVAAFGLLGGLAHAQQPPLEGLLPATTVAVFHLGPASGDLSVLDEVLAGLDTASASETLQRLFRLIDPDDPALEQFRHGDASLMGLFVEELGWMCPAIPGVWDDDAAEGLLGPSLLAVNLSPFNPFPGVIAAVRPSDPGYAATLQDELIACLGSEQTLQQDDVTMYLLGDGGDLPLVVARFDDTFAAATDPDLLRAAIRLARGSDEPSHLQSPIGRAASTFVDGGVGMTVDFGALADGLSAFTAMLAGTPEEELVNELLQTLASLGGAAGRLNVDSQGLRFEGVMTPDPDAGDPALAALIGCVDCAVGASSLLPAGAVSVSGQYLDLAGTVRWLDGRLALLEPMIGERIDTRMLVGMGLGLDLDAHLLDWIGNRWHSAQLDVMGTDVRSWLLGPGNVTTVEVSSEQAAREAIAAWRGALDSLDWLVEELMFEFGMMTDPFGPGPGSPWPEGGVLAVREETYGGLAYERWRLGPFVDVGFMVLDGHLVVAVPARAMRSLIDVHLGAPDALADDTLGAALRAVPSGATAYSVQDVGRQLRAVADVADLMSASLASLTLVAVEEATSDPWDDPWGSSWDDPWDTGDVTGLWRSADRYGNDLLNEVPSVDRLRVPSDVLLDITSEDVLPNGDLGLVLTLEELVEGSQVMIEMIDPERTWDMDTYLYLYDFGAGRIIADNDDAPDTNRSEIIFVVEPGVSYAVVASSWGGSDVGPIQLTTVVQSMPDDADEPPVAEEPVEEELEELDVPTFAELVAMYDVIGDVLYGVAERTDLATSVSTVEDGVRRTIWTLPLR